MEKSSGGNIILPVEKLSSLDVHEPAEVVAGGETANLDETEITACAYDDSPSSAEKKSSEDNITLPVETNASLDADETANAVATEGKLTLMRVRLLHPYVMVVQPQNFNGRGRVPSR